MKYLEPILITIIIVEALCFTLIFSDCSSEPEPVRTLICVESNSKPMNDEYSMLIGRKRFVCHKGSM